MSIITEQDIINTYSKRQQEQCRLYYQYKEIKNQNPTLGYKRIATLLKQPHGKTRWWHANKCIPTPIQTANWLKQRGLIPLELENQKLPIISRLLGSTFGDGGIFENLNGIFLSSSELEAVKEFGEDLNLIFGKEIEKNSRIIEGGEYGHSWCYQNTNRNIIRLFKALGAPIGKKAIKETILPEWIHDKETPEDEFYGAFFGGEINIPKIHINGNHLDTLSIGITGLPELTSNRIIFLEEIKEYLEEKGIVVGSICKSKNKGRDDSTIFKLLISTTLENVLKFNKEIKLYYCRYKPEKLDKTIREFIKIKKQRYQDLLTMGYSEKAALKLLKLSKGSLTIFAEPTEINQ